MATDEEYLDSLLKSMTDNESNRSMEEVMREVSKTPKEDDISFGVEDFFAHFKKHGKRPVFRVFLIVKQQFITLIQ